MTGSFPPPPPPRSDAGGGRGYPMAGTNGKATGSLVCGLVGLLVFGIVLGPIAIWLGTAAKREIAQTGQGGQGQATAGIVLGIIAVVLFFVAIAIVAGTM